MSGISIFMYHQIGRFAPMRDHRANYCDVDRFRAQMRYLKWVGANVLSMSDAAAILRERRTVPARAVVLSFDDGCENFHEYALPVLEEFGYPAIAYIIAGQAGGDAEWLAASGHPTPPLMDYERIREIARRGVEIGSHAYHHVRLAGQAPDVLLREVRDSKLKLESEIGRTVDHFCYPYGSHDLATMQAAADAGYRSAVTCQRGAATSAFDPLALPRKGISFGDDMIGFAWKLHAKNRPKGRALSLGH